MMHWLLLIFIICGLFWMIHYTPDYRSPDEKALEKKRGEAEKERKRKERVMKAPLGPYMEKLREKGWKI